MADTSKKNVGKNTPVNGDDQLNEGHSKLFSVIDNYIYLYHTDTLIAVPTFPETISDNIANEFSSATPLSRSAPIYAFTSAGPRSFQVTLTLHRDLMNEVNTSTSLLNITGWQDNDQSDYVDVLVNQLYSAVLPKYSASEKMVDPPIVAVRFGDQIFCKGVITGGITVEYSGPIISGRSANDGTGELTEMREAKYALVTISFTIYEIDPYDAETVAKVGGFRGLNTTLERRVWKTT